MLQKLKRNLHIFTLGIAVLSLLYCMVVAVCLTFYYEDFSYDRPCEVQGYHETTSYIKGRQVKTQFVDIMWKGENQMDSRVVSASMYQELPMFAKTTLREPLYFYISWECVMIVVFIGIGLVVFTFSVVLNTNKIKYNYKKSLI